MELKGVSLPSRPCVFLRFSRRLGRLLPLRPAVRCERDCLSCPWNGAEQQRRLREGVWRRGRDGLLRLHFVPAGKQDSGDSAREQEEAT